VGSRPTALTTKIKDYRGFLGPPASQKSGLGSAWEAVAVRHTMVLGSGPLGSAPLGALSLHNQVAQGRSVATLTSTAILIPQGKTSEGLLVKSYGAAWVEIARFLGDDWQRAFQIDDRKWEEILAGALHKEGFKVTLTPRSGDHGRDVIAEKSGVGSMRMLGSMKAYGPNHLVPREHVHELLGVVEAEKATKGMIVTTSDFAPQILDAPGLAAAVPNRLEMMNGVQLQEWLKRLASSSG
jgi:restriction system protein